MRRTSPVIAGIVVAGMATACGGGSGSPNGTDTQTRTTSPSVTTASATATPSELTPGGSLGDSAGQVVNVGKAVWAQIDTDLDRIDPSTGGIVRHVDLGANAVAGTTVVGHDVWAATLSGTVVVNTRSHAVVRRFDNVVVPAGSIGWAVDGNRVLRFKLASGKVTGHAPIPRTSDDWSPILAAGEGAAWVGLGTQHEVIRIDATTLRRTVIKGFTGDDSLLVVGVAYGHVWAQQNAVGGGRLYMIDAATDRIVRRTKLGHASDAGDYGGSNIVFFRRAVWTGDSSPTVTEVSATGQVERVIDVPVAPQYLGVTADSIWIGHDLESGGGGLARIALH